MHMGEHPFITNERERHPVEDLLIQLYDVEDGKTLLVKGSVVGYGASLLEGFVGEIDDEEGHVVLGRDTARFLDDLMRRRARRVDDGLERKGVPMVIGDFFRQRTCIGTGCDQDAFRLSSRKKRGKAREKEYAPRVDEGARHKKVENEYCFRCKTERRDKKEEDRREYDVYELRVEDGRWKLTPEKPRVFTVEPGKEKDGDPHDKKEGERCEVPKVELRARELKIPKRKRRPEREPEYPNVANEEHDVFALGDKCHW